MATKRFAGTVEPIATLGVAAWGMAGWVADISFEEWPQQDRLNDGKIRPAMVNDPAWYGFGDASKLVVAEVMRHVGVGEPFNLMLSAVMPGAEIELHADRQPAEWLFRVHVPLLTNDDAWFATWEAGEVVGDGGRRWNMKAGIAYKVNTEKRHAIWNGGDTPRIHLMWDVKEKS